MFFESNEEKRQKSHREKEAAKPRSPEEEGLSGRIHEQP